MSQSDQSVNAYQLRIVLRRTSPHLWRRIVVDSDSALSQLHQTVLALFGWTDVRRQLDLLADYGDRHRNGERVSTVFTESAVNQLVSRRMVKQQQMHWTERGAHILWQVRAQVLNGDLRKAFGRWYSGMKARGEDPVRLVA